MYRPRLDANSSPLTHAVIGAALEVHGVLGNGFLEAVYQEALALEFRHRGIDFVREASIEVRYKGEVLACPYRADFIVGGELLVELKAMQDVGPAAEAQVLHYLKATQLGVGLLFNFGEESLTMRRFVHNHDDPIEPAVGDPLGSDGPIGSA